MRTLYQSSSRSLLHDVPEDTTVTAEMIREVYGNEVANITAGMEKLANPKLRYQ